MNNNVWIIQSIDNPNDYWSNIYGWVDLELAAGFNDRNSNLPVGGQWVQAPPDYVWNDPDTYAP